MLRELYLEEQWCRAAKGMTNGCIEQKCIEDLKQPESDRVHSVYPSTLNTIASDCSVAVGLVGGEVGAKKCKNPLWRGKVFSLGAEGTLFGGAVV